MSLSNYDDDRGATMPLGENRRREATTKIEERRCRWARTDDDRGATMSLSNYDDDRGATMSLSENRAVVFS